MRRTHGCEHSYPGGVASKTAAFLPVIVCVCARCDRALASQGSQSTHRPIGAADGKTITIYAGLFIVSRYHPAAPGFAALIQHLAASPRALVCTRPSPGLRHELN